MLKNVGHAVAIARCFQVKKFCVFLSCSHLKKNMVMPTLALLVLAGSFSAAFISFLVEWFLIYRTEDYQTATEDMKSMNEEIDRLREKKQTLLEKSKISKIDSQIAIKEQNIKNKNQALAYGRMKSAFVVGIVMISFFTYLSSVYVIYINFS